MGRPYSLDEATLARVRRVYAEQAEDVELYAEQLRRWQAGSLNLAQRQEVDRLAGQVEQWRSAVVTVLELAEDLQDSTIEACCARATWRWVWRRCSAKSPTAADSRRAEYTRG